MPVFTHRLAPVLQPVACSSSGVVGSSRAPAAAALVPRLLRRQDAQGQVRTFRLRAAGGGDAQTAQRGLDTLESYWQQTGAEPSPDAAADLAQRAGMSVEQVQRWFGRRTTAKRVMQPLPNVAAPPAASLPEILEPDLEVVPPKQPAAQPPETKPRVTLEELRALNDSVEWRHMTPDAIEAVQSSMKPRKQEWLVLDGKPVPGAKEAVHEGSWYEGNPSLGWASVPDTVDLPRYVDGSALEWANINTKGRNEQGFLEVDIEPPQAEGSEEAITLCWNDLDMPEDDGDVVVFHRDWEAEGRKALKDLQVGDTLTGEIIFRHLYHGALVDVGAEFDGLIMVMEADWFAVRQHLELDTTVTVRVKAIHKAHRFRFPLELECVQPAIGRLLRTPPPKDRPIIIYADEDIEEAAMDAGRYIPPPPDYEAMLRAMREEVATTFVSDDDAKGKAKRVGRGAAVDATASAEDDSPDADEDVDEDGAADEKDGSPL